MQEKRTLKRLFLHLLCMWGVLFYHFIGALRDRFGVGAEIDS